MALETAAAGQLPSPPDSTQHSHCGQAIRDPEVSYRGLLLLTAAKFLFILFPPVVCGASGRVLSEVTKLRDRRLASGAGPREARVPGTGPGSTGNRGGRCVLGRADPVSPGLRRGNAVRASILRFRLLRFREVGGAGGGVRGSRRAVRHKPGYNRRKPGPLRRPGPASRGIGRSRAASCGGNLEGNSYL